MLVVRHGAIRATSRFALVRELLGGRRTLTTTVEGHDGTDRTFAIEAARISLAPWAPGMNRARASAKASSLLVRAVEATLLGERDVPGVASDPQPLGATAVAGGAVRLVAEAARSLVSSHTTTTNYAVAWGTRDPARSPLELPREMHWVEHPPDRFLADPFLARDGDRTYVFVEDYSRTDGYATIAVFEPRDARRTLRTVIDRGSHLSYPFVFQDDETGDWLMLPEMAAERRVTLFRAHGFPGDWREEAILLDDVAAYDPTIHHRDGLYWLFYASGAVGGAGDDELHIAFGESLRGPYVPHPLNPVKSDVVGARPAGRLFEWNGRLIRPGQDSAREYGYAVVFNEVTELTPTGFAEVTVGRLEPDWAPDIRGTHSWDFLDDLVVADAKRIHRRAGRGFRGRRAR